LRSRSAVLWLIEKEWRELTTSRAWWVLLFGMGPLVGASFISAMRTYAEVSGLGGTAAGVGEALSPLVGVWAPTFSAGELAAVFLFPFVVIRLVGGDKQTGAFKLESQHRMSALGRISVKGLVLTAAWIIASAAPLVAILLWKAYGGTVYVPELLTVGGGHLLNAGLTIALAAAMATVSEHPSTAAIMTLGVTVGTWLVNFFAAVQGGVWERVAEYTPTAMVAEFQHGLVRLKVVLIAAALIGSGLALSAIWMRVGVSVRRRVTESAALSAAACAVIFVCVFATPSWDTSEGRINSFSEADEQALREIHQPLRIRAYLAPEDPRRVDLERQALSKLRRVLPDTQVEYVSATSIGLFEQTSEHYGEIWYELGDRKEMNRQTSAEAVLETIYLLAGVSPTGDAAQTVFRGHPLAVPPTGAGVVFYGVWPATIVIAAFFSLRRRS